MTTLEERVSRLEQEHIELRQDMNRMLSVLLEHTGRITEVLVALDAKVDALSGQVKYVYEQGHLTDAKVDRILEKLDA